MVRIPDLLVAQGRFAVSQEPDAGPNLLQIGAQALGSAGLVQETREKVQYQKDKRDADAFNLKAKNDLRLYRTEVLSKAPLEARSPDQITPYVFDSLEKKKAELLKNAPNDIARDEFEQIFSEIRTGAGEVAIRTQVDESQKYRKTLYGQTIDDLNSHVRNGGDINATLQSIDEATQSASSFMSAAELLQNKEIAFGSAKRAHLDYLFEQGKVDEVRTLINDEVFSKELDNKDIGAYRQAIATYKSEEKRRNEAIDYLGGNNAFFDITDDGNKKAMDQIFQDVVQADLFGQDPDKAALAYSATLEMANTGIIPKTMQSYIRAAYVGQEGTDKNLAYQFVSDLHVKNPRAAEMLTLKETQIQEALLYTSLKDNGVPEGEALRIVNDSIYPDNPKVVEVRKAELKNLDPDIDIPSFFSERSLSNPFGVPDIIDMPGYEEAYKLDYKNLWDKYYIATGDEETAHKMTEGIITKSGKYGVSNVTSDDPYVMEYPPEAYYSDLVAFKSDPIEAREDVAQVLRKILVKDAEDFLNKEVNYEDLRVVSSAATNAAVKNKLDPVYLVYLKPDEDTAPQPLFNYTWDRQKIEEELRATADIKRSSTKGKKILPYLRDLKEFYGNNE